MPPEDQAGPPHPRERHDLAGQGRAAAELAMAEAGGRTHHAWLIGGPKGVGKATLAYRFARRLLAGPEERLPGFDGLAVDHASRTARLVAAGSHPNLRTLELASETSEKAASRTISVDAVRQVTGFFAATAADGGRRIGIVDSVDDLTPAAANALLKTVEEPPRCAIVLLISHAPQRVMPTLRSRCRKLTLPPLADDDVAAIVAALGGPDGGDPALVRRAAAASDGSVARALALLDPRRLALLDEVASLLHDLPDPPRRRVLALAERLGDRRAEEEFGLALDAVRRWLEERVEHGASMGPARLAPLAEVCERMADQERAVETYNLDRRPLVISLFRELADAVRRAA